MQSGTSTILGFGDLRGADDGMNMLGLNTLFPKRPATIRGNSSDEVAAMA
jgi:hypothetical protein